MENKRAAKLKSRRQARNIWEKHYKASILPKMQVHHIDGNPFNNSIENLLVCTPDEHWSIHYNQGDKIAYKGKFIQAGNYYYSLSKEEQLKITIKMTQVQSNLWKNSYEWRAKQLARLTGKNNPFYGKTHTKEARDKISKNTKRRKGKDHYLYGKHLSFESIEKISKNRKGKTAGIKNPTWKGYTITPLGAYETMEKAGIIYDITRKSMEYRCKSNKPKWSEFYISKEIPNHVKRQF